MARRFLPLIALLAALLHGIGIVRSPLPAQDGLKFLRVARQFHTQPWGQVIRSSDQHPLYPAMIAATQPLIAVLAGDGADSWRIAAQAVSALASIALLLPLFSLSRALFGEAAGVLSALLFVLLPLPAALGHDTLSDPLSLLLFVSTMALGERALREARLLPAILCGIVSGLGFLTRPEAAIAPLAIVLTGLIGLRPGQNFVQELGDRRFLRLPVMAVVFLAVVGSYAFVKGEVSEKLALRRAVAIASRHDEPARAKPPLPAGLDHPHWDFAAKEESDRQAGMSFLEASVRLASRYAEAMGYLLVPLVFWAMWRLRAASGSRLLAVYAVIFVGVVIRHSITFGYLSARHTLSLVVLSLPFAGAGILEITRRIRERREARGVDTPASRTRRRVVAVGALLCLGIGVQLYHPPHPSRWGHGAAGRWLAANAGNSDKVLDTRGWATFVSGRPGLDYWHVKQALIDPKLSFVVVGEDERTAPSRRGETLRAILAYAAEPIISFPEREGGSTVGVRIYRFVPPSTWKGLQP